MTTERWMALFLVLGLGWGCSPQPETVGAAGVEVRREPVTTAFPGRDPSIRWDSDERLHVVYVEGTGDESPWIAYRRLSPEPTEPVRVSPPDRSVKSRNEVPPVVEVQPDGRIVVAYTVSLPGRRQGEFLYQTSVDDGASWSDPLPVHDDGRPTGSRSFIDSTLLRSGRVAFSWLDNRMGQQGLIYAELDSNGRVGPNEVLDEVTCQCCGTDLLQTTDGSLFLSYRELDESTGFRDIALMRRSAPRPEFEALGILAPDGWEIDGCPHTGPRLTEARDGSLWSIWFTGVDPSVRVASSSDGGESFSPAESLAVTEGEVLKVAHPEIGSLPDGRLIAFYESGGDSFNRIVAREYDGSEWGPPEVIAEDAVYPRFETNGDRSVVAWTQKAGTGTEVVVREVEM